MTGTSASMEYLVRLRQEKTANCQGRAPVFLVILVLPCPAPWPDRLESLVPSISYALRILRMYSVHAPDWWAGMGGGRGAWDIRAVR